MDPHAKPAYELMPEDFQKYCVWEQILDDEENYPDESWVRPVVKLPVTSLGNRTVGLYVTMNNGEKKCATFDNISLQSLFSTEQFLYVRIWGGGSWIDLARYFDSDYSRNGPQQLAAALGLSLNEVFPITYDMSGIAVGYPDVIKGRINAEPSQKLTQEEIMKLILAPR